MDNTRGYVKTATEVSSDNSALMRNVRRHENGLEGAIVSIARAVMHAHLSLGENVLDEGEVCVRFDDSIIQDTAAEKEQDMREVGVTMGVWEHRMRWYGEEESVARARAAEIGAGKVKERGHHFDSSLILSPSRTDSILQPHAWTMQASVAVREWLPRLVSAERHMRNLSRT
ncbi:hypothetical protein [Adlercreutzia sp. ZJ242]|uniref:hypothetical protein n=1 Tax=Adlercreutzia sp. ZJ242 TaxID=2709409 RepID=UPI0013EC3A98|nr:hypothetical protein [Adlercreutzia sp. ZJ242]